MCGNSVRTRQHPATVTPNPVGQPCASGSPQVEYSHVRATNVVKAWHAVVESGDPALLDGMLADDVVFRSPAVFAPQPGKDLTAHYLRSALAVLGPSLRYIGEWYGPSSAVLEFEAELDGITSTASTCCAGTTRTGWSASP